MQYKATLVVLLAVLAVSSAQIVRLGRCPANVTAMQDFNLQRYLGTWFEYARFPNLFEADGICVTATYSTGANGSVVVNNTEINSQTGKSSGIIGSAKLVTSGELLVNFPGQPTFGAKSNYWVLDTDYYTYSVVYSCQELSFFVHSTYAWVLTRQRQPSVTAIQTAASVFNRNKLNFGDFEVVEQAVCN